MQNNHLPYLTEEMSEEARWEKAFALARMLDGISVHDAEIILRDTAQFIQRGARVTTKSSLFLSLEGCLLCDS